MKEEKKTMKKKFLAILLAATLSVSVLPVTCIAGNSETDFKKCVDFHENR